MNVLKTDDPAEFERFANECLREGHEGLVIHIGEKTCVWTGALASTFDREYAEQIGLDIGQGMYLGGTIVCFPGDLSLCLTTWGRTQFGQECMDALEERLVQKGISVSRHNNDLLADGKKVASWASSKQRTGWVQTVVHFSVNVDGATISRICTKPPSNPPGALSEYGMTANELMDMVFNSVDF